MQLVVPARQHSIYNPLPAPTENNISHCNMQNHPGEAMATRSSSHTVAETQQQQIQHIASSWAQHAAGALHSRNSVQKP